MSDTDFAKTHLRDHLATLLIEPVSEGFWSIHKTSKELCERNGQPDQILRTFQNMLTKIPEWTDSTLATEVDRIVKTTKCSYLDDLLMGVFIAYMKSFTNLHYRGSASHVDIDFDRPTIAKFLHELYIQSARKLWQVAYLFKTAGVSSEQQARNRQDIEQLILDRLEHVIRSFLPWETIAKQFSETQTAPPPAPASSGNRVQFEDTESSDGEDYSDSDDESVPPPLNMTDEAGSIEFESLDAKEEPEPEPMDPMKEIESKMDSSLVLNL
jgi:hypothetical protein